MSRSRPVPRVSLTPQEAADSAGVSLSTFKKWIQPELRVVRFGANLLIPLTELQAWVDANAERVLPDPEVQSTQLDAPARRAPPGAGAGSSCQAPAQTKGK